MKRHRNNGRRACGYIRMSSPQQESSPAQQRREITALAKKKGYRIVAWYADEGISGDEIEKRPDFCRMLKDARDDKFDIIICWDQDRFGRFDSLRAGYVIEPLRSHGVRLVTITQGEIDWNDFAGRMIYAIQQEGKNQFLISLSNNMLRGRLQIAREGHGVGRAAYGYDRVFFDASGKLVHRVVGREHFRKPKGWKAKIDISTDKQQVDTLRWMFDQYANTDANCQSIARELNQRDIRTGFGNRWKREAVKAILKNPVYIGRMIFGKMQTGRFNWVGNGGVGGDGPVVVDDAHPPLVDKDTFDRVQKKLVERAGRTKRTRCNGYVLSGLLKCANTNHPMYGRQAWAGNRLKYYCHMATDGPVKGCFGIRKEPLEAFVISKMVELLSSEELEGQLKKAVAKKLQASQVTASTAESVRRQVAALNKKIAKGAERLLLLDGDDLPDASAVLAGWREQRRTLEGQLDEIETKTVSSPEQETARIMKELADLRKTFQSADPAKLRTALAAVIEDITLHWTKGGPRKWRLQRGVIRLGDIWQVMRKSMR